MKVASFDVGTKNLAFCILDNNRIQSWNVLEISYRNNEQLCVNVVKALDAFEELLNVDTVVIEKQPSKNNKMRIVEALLNAYFVINGATKDTSPITKVAIYSSKHKLGSNTIKGKTNYRERKKLGVTRCAEFLKETADVQDERFAKMFTQSKKKDDLADSLLQGLSYMKDDTLTSIEHMDLDTVCKISARKPNKKQEAKMYSKSNLKYLFVEFRKTSAHKEALYNHVKDSTKLQRALKHWYDEDIDKSLREFDIHFE